MAKAAAPVLNPPKPHSSVDLLQMSTCGDEAEDRHAAHRHKAEGRLKIKMDALTTFFFFLHIQHLQTFN